MGFTAVLGAGGTSPAQLDNIELGVVGPSFVFPTQPFAIVSTQIRFQTAKAVRRSTNQLDTIGGFSSSSVPSVFDMATSEIFPYVVDVTNYLGIGDTITNVVPVLTYLSTSAIVTTGWQGTIIVLGKIITIPITGSALSYGQTYQIATTFTASSTKISTFTSTINVVA